MKDDDEEEQYPELELVEEYLEFMRQWDLYYHALKLQLARLGF